MPKQNKHICFLPLKYLFMQQSTESQSCQKWQGPLEPIWSNSLLKHHLQPGAKTIPSHHFNMCRYGNSTTSLSNLRQCLSTPTMDKNFLMFRLYIPCFSLCPLPLILSLGTSEESGSDFSASSLQVH